MKKLTLNNFLNQNISFIENQQHSIQIINHLYHSPLQNLFNKQDSSPCVIYDELLAVGQINDDFDTFLNRPFQDIMTISKPYLEHCINEESYIDEPIPLLVTLGRMYTYYEQEK